MVPSSGSEGKRNYSHSNSLNPNSHGTGRKKGKMDAMGTDSLALAEAVE
jgi:hypothetical protein